MTPINGETSARGELKGLLLAAAGTAARGRVTSLHQLVHGILCFARKTPNKLARSDVSPLNPQRVAGSRRSRLFRMICWLVEPHAGRSNLRSRSDLEPPCRKHTHTLYIRIFMNVIKKQKEQSVRKYRPTAKRTNDEYLDRDLEIVRFKHKIALFLI